MTGQTTLTAAGGVVVAAAVGGPLVQVFNELYLVLAIMGAAGGVTWGLANRRNWREVARGLVLGALLASGLGAISPHLVEWLTGVEFQPGGASVSVLASCAFFLGMAQDLVFARLKKVLEP